MAAQEPESEPKVSIDNLAPPNEASLTDDQITLTANQEQNDSILHRQTLDITATTPNSSHSDLQASPVRQLTDFAIQSPSNFRRCCDQLFTPLWNLLAGVSRPTVEPAQDTPACSHNASLNQMPVQAPIEDIGQESPANLDPLHEPSPQKPPTKSALPSLRHSHITTEPSLTCTKIRPTDNLDESIAAQKEHIINSCQANNFIVLDGEPSNTHSKLPRPLILEAEPTHQQLIILDRVLPSTTVKNPDLTLSALSLIHEKASILPLPFVPQKPQELPLLVHQVSPLLADASPLPLNASPSTAETSPLAAQASPSTADRSPSAEVGNCSKEAPSATEAGGRAMELEPASLSTATAFSLPAKKRIQVLSGYTDVIRSLLQSKSKAPFVLAGINIYEQLAQIEDSATRCLEGRSDSILSQLIEMTRQRVDLKSDYEVLARQQELVCGVAEVLDVATNSQGDCTQTGSEVAQSVQDLMDYYGELGELYPEDQAIITHIKSRTEEWSKGLFYCYEERGSPRTNNSLEQYNDVLKRQRRRVTGQKNVADYIIRHGPYAIFHDSDDQPDDILARFQNVSIEDLKQEQVAFHAATRCPRNIRSFRRDPEAYLNKLEAIWLEGLS